MVVTSPGTSEGRTSAVVNLAVAAAGAGMSVLVVDADLRRPHAARLLAVDRTAGLTDVLSGTETPSAVIRTSPQGVDVLAPGPLPSNPAELLAGGALADLFEDLTERYALVLVDVPPLLPVTDAAVVAAAADGAVVLARRGTTARDDVAAAVRTLETAGAHRRGHGPGRRPRPPHGPPRRRREPHDDHPATARPACRPCRGRAPSPLPGRSRPRSPPPPRSARSPTRAVPAAQPAPFPPARPAAPGARTDRPAADDPDAVRTETVALASRRAARTVEPPGSARPHPPSRDGLAGGGPAPGGERWEVVVAHLVAGSP